MIDSTVFVRILETLDAVTEGYLRLQNSDSGFVVKVVEEKDDRYGEWVATIDPKKGELKVAAETLLAIAELPGTTELRPGMGAENLKAYMQRKQQKEDE